MGDASNAMNRPCFTTPTSDVADSTLHTSRSGCLKVKVSSTGRGMDATGALPSLGTNIPFSPTKLQPPARPQPHDYKRHDTGHDQFCCIVINQPGNSPFVPLTPKCPPFAPCPPLAAVFCPPFPPSPNQTGLLSWYSPCVRHHY